MPRAKMAMVLGDGRECVRISQMFREANLQDVLLDVASLLKLKLYDAMLHCKTGIDDNMIGYMYTAVCATSGHMLPYAMLLQNETRYGCEYVLVSQLARRDRFRHVCKHTASQVELYSKTIATSIA